MHLANDLIHALDPVAFAEDVLGFRPDPWQVTVMWSTAKRHLLNCSRQSGKSTIAAVMAAHKAIYAPGSLTLLISPTLRQSGELFKKASDYVHRVSGTRALPEDNKLSLQLQNGSRIVSLPGSEATIRGFSAPDLIVEDESARVHDDLNAAIRPMLAVSGGQLILMSTPFGQRGHFFDAWTNGDDDWQRTMVDAYQVPRISPEFLEAERAEMGPTFFESEYMCKFVANVDSVFRYEDVRAALSYDVRPLFQD